MKRKKVQLSILSAFYIASSVLYVLFNGFNVVGILNCSICVQESVHWVLSVHVYVHFH